MKIVKSALLSALIGLMIGSVMSMLIMIFIGHPIIVSPTELTGILVMSILISLLSPIFMIERLPFGLALPLHFVLVGVIVFSTNYLLGGLFGTRFTITILYVVIYVVVWLFIRFWWYLDAQRINSYIRKRRRP